MPRVLARNFGTSLLFNGTSSYVMRTASSVFSNTGYSVEMWFKGNPQNNMCLYSEGSTASNNPLFAFLTESTGSLNRIRAFVRNDTANQLLDSTGSFPASLDNKWHHIVWTDNNGTANLYIDGVASSTSMSYAYSGTFTMNRTSVGALVRTTIGNYFTGNIDNVRTYTTALTQDQVTQLYTSGVAATTPYFEWKFDEGSGNTATDTSGNARDGDMTGHAASYSSVVPAASRSSLFSKVLVRNFGSCLSFNAGSNRASATLDFARTAGQTFSSGCWFKRTSVPIDSNGMTFIGVRNGSSAGKVMKLFLFQNLTIGFNYDSTGSGEQIASTIPIDTKWHHCVGTYDGANCRLYIDGALVTTGVSKPSAALSATSLALGVRSDTLIESFSGFLDEPFITTSCLTLSEIQDIYFNGKYDLSRITHLWNLNEGSGSTCTDSLGTLNLTITGATYSTSSVSSTRTFRNSPFRTNLCSNPGFETNASTFWSNSATRSADFAHTGGFSAKVTSTFTNGTITGGHNYLNLGATAFAPVIGKTYNYSGYIYIPVGSPITKVNTCRIRDFTTYGGLGTTTNPTLTAGAWTRFSATATATPANPLWRFTAADPVAAGFTGSASYYVDDILIEENRTTPNTYFDGSSGENYSWSGTANLSTSYYTKPALYP